MPTLTVEKKPRKPRAKKLVLEPDVKEKPIVAEDTDVASGSDRILWLCSNFSIYKRKTEEEMADESVSQNNVSYNLKLIPVVARHGKGIDAGDYINISGNYEYGRITEGPTRNEFHQLRSTRINNGFQIEELPDEISATN